MSRIIWNASALPSVFSSVSQIYTNSDEKNKICVSKCLVLVQSSGAEFLSRNIEKIATLLFSTGILILKGGEGEGKKTPLSIKASVLLANQNWGGEGEGLVQTKLSYFFLLFI